MSFIRSGSPSQGIVGWVRSSAVACALACAVVCGLSVAPSRAAAQCTTTSPTCSLVTPTAKGIIGLGLIGAELGFVVPAIVQNAAHTGEWWPYLVFPVLGGAGGAVGGYFLEQGTQTSAEVDVAMLAIGVGLIVPALVTTMVLTSYDPARDSQSSAGEDAEADEIPRTEDGTSTEAVQVEESGESTGSEAAPASDGAAAPAPSSRLERTGTSLMAGGPGLLRFDGTRVLLGVPMVQRLATFTAEEARTLRVTQSADVNVPVLSASF